MAKKGNSVTVEIMPKFYSIWDFSVEKSRE